MNPEEIAKAIVNAVQDDDLSAEVLAESLREVEAMRAGLIRMKSARDLLDELEDEGSDEE